MTKIPGIWVHKNMYTWIIFMYFRNSLFYIITNKIHIFRYSLKLIIDGNRTYNLYFMKILHTLYADNRGNVTSEHDTPGGGLYPRKNYYFNRVRTWRMTWTFLARKWSMTRVTEHVETIPKLPWHDFAPMCQNGSANCNRLGPRWPLMSSVAPVQNILRPTPRPRLLGFPWPGNGNPLRKSHEPVFT